MVDKKGLKAVNRNEIILILLVLGFIGYAFAASTFTGSLENGGNYTGTSLFLNITTADLNNSVAGTGYNATCFYNASGGDAYLNATYNNLTGTMWNTTNTFNGFNVTINPTTLLGGLADGRTYNISCFVDNGTQEFISVTNVTIDNTVPEVNFTGATSSLANNGNYSASDITGLLNINVSVADAIFPVFAHSGGDVFMNLTNSTGQVNFTELANLTSPFYNMTINLSSATVYPDGKYNLTIWANDSIYLKNSAGTVTANLNNSEYIQITLDRTNPTSVVLTRGTGSTRTQNVITITAADATSGIDNCIVRSGSSTAFASSSTTITGRGTGTQTLTHTGLNCGTSYSYLVTCYDQVDNSRISTSTSFSTSSCSSPGDSNGGTVVSIEEVNVLNIDSETGATLSNFDEEMGVEGIKISVTEEANNVKVTVRKFDTEPTEITVSKSGQVHKYLQITSQNLATKLERAIITIKVQKNWLLDNEIDKANMALFKFNEVTEAWGELLTVYQNEDETYYYYDVELDSFSYFAIAEKVIEDAEPESEERNLLWLWIVIGIVVVAIIAGGGIAAKKRK